MVAQFLPLIGSVLGGLFGGGDEETTAKKEPWGPAQPYILDNLKDTAKLKNYYQQNPFNEQQKTSYQNTFGDLDNFRQNIAPDLMDFANRGMTSTYQRQTGGNPGDRSGYGGAVQPGGLLQTGQGPFSVYQGPGQQPQGTPQQGLLANAPSSNEYQGGSDWRNTNKQYPTTPSGESVPGSAPIGGSAPQRPRTNLGGGGIEGAIGSAVDAASEFFLPQQGSAPQSQYANPSYGMIDWNAQNPWANGAIQPDAPAPAIDPAYAEWLRLQAFNMLGYGDGSGGMGGGGGDDGSGGSGTSGSGMGGDGPGGGW